MVWSEQEKTEGMKAVKQRYFRGEGHSEKGQLSLEVDIRGGRVWRKRKRVWRVGGCLHSSFSIPDRLRDTVGDVAGMQLLCKGP